MSRIELPAEDEIDYSRLMSPEEFEKVFKEESTGKKVDIISEILSKSFIICDGRVYNYINAGSYYRHISRWDNENLDRNINWIIHNFLDKSIDSFSFQVQKTDIDMAKYRKLWLPC